MESPETEVPAAKCQRKACKESGREGSINNRKTEFSSFRYDNASLD